MHRRQALTDWVPLMPTTADGCATEASRKERDNRVEEFANPNRDMSAKGKAVSWKKPLEPNGEVMHAIDHSLQEGAGISLASFMSGGAPLLSSDGRRYFVPCSDLPPAWGGRLGMPAARMHFV